MSSAIVNCIISIFQYTIGPTCFAVFVEDPVAGYNATSGEFEINLVVTRWLTNPHMLHQTFETMIPRMYTLCLFVIVK